MGKKGSLREFQAHLATRLAGASNQSAAGLLGVQSGADYWLLSLSDSGEISPLPPLTSVPLTKPWFVGVANIRGNLYSVTDLSAFQSKDATPQNTSSRLLLIGTRHGNNAALLVTRTLGLKNPDDFTAAVADAADPVWGAVRYKDSQGGVWRKLSVRDLLADNDFMNIGV